MPLSAGGCISCGVLLLHGLVASALTTASKVNTVINLADSSFSCDNDTKIKLEHGYLSFNLVGNDDQKLPRDCKLKVEADRKGDGLMVHLHNSYLRRRNQTDECIDSVAFGEDDLVPFLTIKKSGPLCGPQPDWSYDITNGKLIFWLHLSHLRPEKHRETFNAVHLNITITPYTSKKKQGYERCSNGYFIHNHFFCDGVANCALDKQGPKDEMPGRCNTTPRPPPPTTTSPSTSFPTIQTQYEMDFESEEIRLGTIIAVSLSVLTSLACCMVCCVKRCGRVSQPPTPTHHPTSHGMSLAGLPGGGLGVHPSQREYTMPGLNMGGCPTPPSLDTPKTPIPVEDCPPPSYGDLFPDNVDTGSASAPPYDAGDGM